MICFSLKGEGHAETQGIAGGRSGEAGDGSEASQDQGRVSKCAVPVVAGFPEAFCGSVAIALGWHANSVRKLQARYCKEGATALKRGGKGGRYYQNLTLEEERQLLQEFLAQSERGGILEVSRVKAADEQALGSQVDRVSDVSASWLAQGRAPAPPPQVRGRHPGGV